MGINLQSLSITSAFNSIVNFFKSQENATKWKSLTSGAEGTFLIRMLANVFSTLSYRIVAQSRENYLSTAALPSSNIGLSVNLGYSVFRGSNLKRMISITPNGNYTLPRLSEIGKYNDTYGIYVLNKFDDKGDIIEGDIDLVEGTPAKVSVVIGQIKEEKFIAGTSSIKIFSLFTTGISEDYTLYLGSQELPTTDIIKQMTYDKYLVRTNPYSSVDIMYLNTFPGAKYVYGTDSEFTLRYIELDNNVPDTPFTDDMFSYGTLNDYYNISTYLPFESVEQMKVNAPLDHETQNIIRSKQDYANRMQQIVPAVMDASYKAVTPTYTQITYLKNDFTLLSNSEESGVQNLLKEENFFGTPLPDITHPRREVAHLAISVALNTKYKNLADINLDIENILKSYYDAILGSTFNTFDLERKIESLSYVRYARVSHVIDERETNKQYQVGYIITREGESYIASKILGLSGSTIPDWNIPVSAGSAIDTGLETSDGSIIWRAYKRLPNMPKLDFNVRQNNMQYGIGDYVYDDTNAPDYMFKCVDLIKSSGFNEPNLTYAEAGDFFVDGSLVWVAKEYSSTYPSWNATTNYRLGTSVNVTSSSDLSLECISYRGTSGTQEDLAFEQNSYPILAQGSNTFTVAGNMTFYFRTGDIVSALYNEAATSFAVVSSSFDGTNTIITVSHEIDVNTEYTELLAVERGTRDGQILWKLVEDPTNITYPWNGYVVFDHTLSIIN